MRHLLVTQYLGPSRLDREVAVEGFGISFIEAALALLLRDEDLRRRMGNAGRVAVEAHYNWDRVARDTREFAREVTSP